MVHVTFLRARHKIRLGDQIRRADRVLAEAQVADRYAARLLRVVSEVRLRIKIGVVADNFDR